MKTSKQIRSDETLVEEAEKSIGDLPHAKFHRLISRGLLGIYLSDQKYQHKRICTKWHGAL